MDQRQNNYRPSSSTANEKNLLNSSSLPPAQETPAEIRRNEIHAKLRDPSECGDTKTVISLCEELTCLEKAIFKSGSIEIPRTLRLVAKLLLSMGEKNLAARYFKECIETIKRPSKEEHDEMLLECHLGLAEIDDGDGSFGKAQAHLPADLSMPPIRDRNRVDQSLELISEVGHQLKSSGPYADVEKFRAYSTFFAQTLRKVMSQPFETKLDKHAVLLDVFRMALDQYHPYLAFICADRMISNLEAATNRLKYKHELLEAHQCLITACRFQGRFRKAEEAARDAIGQAKACALPIEQLEKDAKHTNKQASLHNSSLPDWGNKPQLETESPHFLPRIRAPFHRLLARGDYYEVIEQASMMLQSEPSLDLEEEISILISRSNAYLGLGFKEEARNDNENAFNCSLDGGSRYLPTTMALAVHYGEMVLTSARSWNLNKKEFYDLIKNGMRILSVAESKAEFCDGPVVYLPHVQDQMAQFYNLAGHQDKANHYRNKALASAQEMVFCDL